MTPLIEKTPAQHVAAQLQAGPRERDDSPYVRANIRIPASTLALLEAFAEHADRSRNYMIDQLVIVGGQAVLDALPEAERDAVQLLWLQKQGQLTQQAIEEGE
jgi:hypothetical protein